MNALPTPIRDDFWTHETPLFQGSFRYYHNTLRPVRGKIHVSEERYVDVDAEIIPIANPRQGTRTYVLMHPYVFEPKILLTVGLYNRPKQYADQDAAIGEALSSRSAGVSEVQIGNAQAWYYPQDKTIVLWECFLWPFVRDHHLPTDKHMKALWAGFETALHHLFPAATRFATPFNDPMATSIGEYQTFLRSLDYQPIPNAKAAFGKAVGRKA